MMRNSQLSPTWAKCVTWLDAIHMPRHQMPPRRSLARSAFFHIDGPLGVSSPVVLCSDSAEISTRELLGVRRQGGHRRVHAPLSAMLSPGPHRQVARRGVMTSRLPCAAVSPRGCTAAICPMPVMIPVNMAWIVAGFAMAQNASRPADPCEHAQVEAHALHILKLQRQPCARVPAAPYRRYPPGAEQRRGQIQQQFVHQPARTSAPLSRWPGSTCNSFTPRACQVRAAGRADRPAVRARQMHHRGASASSMALRAENLAIKSGLQRRWYKRGQV